MKRLPDWEARLATYLQSVADRPHAYGSHDCALHGASAVEALTGDDHGRPFRGRYRTARGALVALKRHGAGALDATFDRHLERIAPAFAGRGDIVLSAGAIGVCIGGDAVFASDHGLARRPRAAWSTAWRVPHE